MTLMGHKENHIESRAISPDGKTIAEGTTIGQGEDDRRTVF